MRTLKQKLFLSLVGTMLCAGIYITLANTTKSTITDATMLANVEALTRSEGQDYNNAKLAYCSSTSSREGCKSAFLRNCTGVFCN